ncbi:MAG: peptide ABC transporter substrate-binding protein [Chloroflexi bacterium]|nr:peptide ABC transporter substrate-binding protein [Chloroflexota bacterium]
MIQRFAILLNLIGLFAAVIACAPVPTPMKETVIVKETVMVKETVRVVITPTPTALPIKMSGGIVIGAGIMNAKHFNPIWLNSAPQFLAFPLILPALTWFDDKAQPIPDLATKIEIAPSANAYTFTLPANATWSDGTRLTTKDVAFTYKLALDPAINSSLWGTNLASVKGAFEYQHNAAKDVEGIKVIDDQTIRFELRESNGTFLFNTYLGILPSHILGKADAREIEKQPYIDAPTVTSGPYEFVKYELGKFIQLKKKSNHWGKPVSVDEITIRMFDSPAASFAALEAGDAHLAAISLDESARLRKLPHLDMLTARGTNAYALHVDARTKDQLAALNRPRDQGGRGYAIARAPKPYLADKRFRQALSYALDRKAIVQSVVNGEGAPIVSPLFAPDWTINPNLIKYDTNLDRARALMREAGIAFDAAGTALFENRPIALVYLASTSEDARKLGEAIQNQLIKVGIRVDIKLVPYEVFLQAAIDGEGDLIRGVGTRLGADPSVSALYYTCKAGWAELVMGYCNPRFDDAMTKGNAVNRNEDRQKAYWDASALLNDELPSIFLFAPNVFVGVNKGVSGVKPSVDPSFLTWNIAEWTIQK